MRISDWSSDVCSSDLVLFLGDSGVRVAGDAQRHCKAQATGRQLAVVRRNWSSPCDSIPRSEERRVGKECVSTCRYRRKTNNQKNKKLKKKNHNLNGATK